MGSVEWIPFFASLLSRFSAHLGGHDMSLATLSGCRFGVCGVYDTIRVFQRFDFFLFFPLSFFLCFFFCLLPQLHSFSRKDCVGLDQRDDIIYRDHLGFLSRND